MKAPLGRDLHWGTCLPAAELPLGHAYRAVGQWTFRVEVAVRRCVAARQASLLDLLVHALVCLIQRSECLIHLLRYIPEQ